ncbi:hypothetical protein EVAR_65851_1 [Eumeta japonica]|uniref:Uncharacterized protein n=1 Tax=Eumeta variegata TaxID=151549 RepID=A0A4C2A0M3_EUMVA|nr:hypothetical protein EVAR_65851_1 [Eumeta japonica]
MEAKRKSFLAERGLLKDIEDYCASSASPDSISEMEIEKEPMSRTTVHYSSDECKSVFGSNDLKRNTGAKEKPVPISQSDIKSKKSKSSEFSVEADVDTSPISAKRKEQKPPPIFL